VYSRQNRYTRASRTIGERDSSCEPSRLEPALHQRAICNGLCSSDPASQQRSETERTNPSENDEQKVAKQWLRKTRSPSTLK
jgi:hypothetical protein